MIALTFRILKFNVTLVGEKNSGKNVLFPRIDGTNSSVREEIISEVEADIDILLTGFELPSEREAAIGHSMVSEGIVGVFDVASDDSFEILRNFLSDIKTEHLKKREILVIGHDSGVTPRVLTVDTITDLTKTTGAIYLETSPKFKKGLDIMMRRFASNLIRNANNRLVNLHFQS